MRESKEGKPICSSRLSRPCFTLHELMSRVWPVRRSSQTESIVVSVSIHQINSVHSLSRDNPRIPTNPLSESQQPPLLWRQWIRTKPCSKLRLCLIQTEAIFQLHRTWRSFLLNGIIRCLLYDDFLWPHFHMLVWNAYIWAFLCAYICAFVRKWSYTWE